MIEYLKTIILAVFTGITAPLPVSSSAHFNFLSNVLGFSENAEVLSLYYSGFLVAFAIVIIISFRKIFKGCFKAMFISKKNEKAYAASSGFRFILKNIGVSIIPTLVLFIPVSKDKLLMDLFDNFLNLNSVILSGFACVISACVLIIALWYSKKKDSHEESASIKTTLRLSLYQLPCYIIPGFSHIASGVTNLTVCDVKSKTFLSELYVYLAPSMLIVGLVKIIRAIAGGVLFDPVIMIIGMVFFAITCKLIISLTAKTNLRRLFGFFCVYSVIFGVFIAVTSFYI